MEATVSMTAEMSVAKVQLLKAPAEGTVSGTQKAAVQMVGNSAFYTVAFFSAWFCAEESSHYYCDIAGYY